jgi:hypothetical protein
MKLATEDSLYFGSSAALPSMLLLFAGIFDKLVVIMSLL